MSETQPTRDQLLAMAYADGELDAEARREFERRMRTEPALGREVTAQRRLAILARQASPPEPMDHEWARLRAEPSWMAASRAGWVALVAGAGGLFSWVVFEIWRSTLAPVPKACLLAILGGLTVLVVLACRARLRTMAFDPYREVQR